MSIRPMYACAVLIAAAIPIAASAHCAGKHTGNHPHCGGGDPPPDPDASSCPGDFPAFAYTVETRNKRGHTVQSDLKVSNADGTCTVLVHSVFTADTYDDLTFSFDTDSGKYRIAYNYESDESDPKKGPARPNIRVLEFSVSDDQGETRLNEALPLQIHKIYRYSGNASGGRAIFGMDMSGGNLVFTEIDGSPAGHKIKIIDDVGNCIGTIGPEPDDSCAGPAVFESDPGAFFPKWGLDSSRIYFEYQGYGSSGSEEVLAFIDRVGPGSWSAPGAVRNLEDGGGGFWHGTAALWDHDGSGLSEVLTASVYGVLQLLDVSADCTAVASATVSCLDLGFATIVNFQTTVPHGKWTSHTTLDAGPNLLVFDNGSLKELDPDSGIDAQIIKESGIGWWWFDPLD